MDLHAFLNILHAFWNILHAFWNILHAFGNILHAFWNILDAFCNILEHSVLYCLLLSLTVLYYPVLSCTVLYCLVLSCTNSVCVHSLEFQVDDTHTHRQTDTHTLDLLSWVFAAKNEYYKIFSLQQSVPNFGCDVKNKHPATKHYKRC